MNFTELPTSWAWRIKKINLTQAKFAQQAGVSYGALNRAINKKTDPTLQFVDKVERKLRELEGQEV